MNENRDNSQKVANFRRFYASFNHLPCMGDREELKRQIVHEYTWGRTDSLREMSRDEYNACCEGLEKLTGRKDELKRRRKRVPPPDAASGCRYHRLGTYQ